MLIRKPLWLMSTEGGAAGAGEVGTGEAAATGGSAGDSGAEVGKPEGDQAGGEAKTFTQADVDRIIAGRLQKYADYDDLKKQVEEARTANLSEQDKLVEEAKRSARTEAASEFGKRLARTEFDALAGRRNPEYDTDAALEFIDLGRFVGEDGEPDREAIKAAVDRLIPAPSNTTPSFDGGTRRPAEAPQDMNTFLRKATGRA